MPKKRYTPEEIIQHLRTVELDTGKGLAVFDACRKLGITEQKAGAVTERRLFYTLKEAQILREHWRIHYNTVRPHRSLGGGQPPAPETIQLAS